MSGLLSNATLELLLALAGCGLLVAVGAWLVGRCKQMVYEESSNSNELMSTFSELHQQGELSDEEYKNIKTRLAAKLQLPARSTGVKS
jgi:uncharacterized membrane protein